MDTATKISSLQQLLVDKGLDAWMVPGTDPHQNEYLASRWYERSWLTGFTGSAGVVVVTRDKAAIWVDFRYFAQADRELAGMNIIIHKIGEPGVPGLYEWLKSEMPEGDKLGIAGDLLPVTQYRNIVDGVPGVHIETGENLLDLIWEDRPPVPSNPIFEHDVRFAGESRRDKIDRIKKRMQEKKVDCHIVSAMDDIAWAFNLRGSDIDYNPVFYSFAAFTLDKTMLFVNRSRLDDAIRNRLEADGVNVQDYEALDRFIEGLDERWTVLVNGDKTSRRIQESIEKRCKIEYDFNIPTLTR